MIVKLCHKTLRPAQRATETNHLLCYIDRYVTSSPTPAAILSPLSEGLRSFTLFRVLCAFVFVIVGTTEMNRCDREPVIQSFHWFDRFIFNWINRRSFITFQLFSNERILKIKTKNKLKINYNISVSIFENFQYNLTFCNNLS